MLVLSFTLPVLAADFVEINIDDRSIIYLDLSSIEERTSYKDNYIVAWVKWVPWGENDSEWVEAFGGVENVDYMLEFYAFDKKLRQGQIISQIIYGRNGQMLSNLSRPFSSVGYTEIIPVTYGEAIYDAVMSYYKKKK